MNLPPKLDIFENNVSYEIIYWKGFFNSFPLSVCKQKWITECLHSHLIFLFFLTTCRRAFLEAKRPELPCLLIFFFPPLFVENADAHMRTSLRVYLLPALAELSALEKW